MDKFRTQPTVAQTILEQLKATSMQKMMCWGTREIVGLSDGLKFKVSGMKFKGYVFILYESGSDTYKVQLVAIRKGQGIVKKEVDNVYCDNLGDVIDGLVER